MIKPLARFVCRASMAAFILCIGISVGPARSENGSARSENGFARSESGDPPGAPSSDNKSYGLLWLDIQPAGSNIALDGHFLDADIWLVSVPPGSHDLEVRKPGFQPYDGHFDIQSGQSLHLDVHLDVNPAP